MRKLKTSLIVVFLLITTVLRADEGMWLLTMLNKTYEEMKKQGFKLKPEDIYSINKNCIKDAIVIFGGGCTGEIVSDQGLLFTNHHCGYASIQFHSSVEHDYLRDGFWAKNKDEELVTPGLTATFLVKIEDVTAKVLTGINANASEKERLDAIKIAAKQIEDEAIKGTTYEARVASIFGGNSYYLFLYERYKDVRLVGTPPDAIGKFGGDTDNWMWPRHTGDFSVFRVYTGKDGKPAEYSKDNIPLKPKHFLPISIKGVQKGDFTMIMGYPGRTQRYMTSFEVNEVLNVTNPARIKVRGIRQDIIWADMMADEKVRIQYASKYAMSSNYWKFAIGENKGIRALGVVAKKQETEKQFTDWLGKTAGKKELYGEALPFVEKALSNRKNNAFLITMYAECLTRGIEIVGFANTFRDLASILHKTDAKKEEIDAIIVKLKTTLGGFFKDYNMATDKKVAKAMLKTFAKDVPSEKYPVALTEIKQKYAGDFDKFVEELFSTSMFANQEKLEKFLNNPQEINLTDDIAYKLASSAYSSLMAIASEQEKYNEDYQKGMRLFIAGQMEMQPTKLFYPDANSTMRLTWGKVGDYRPRDGVMYDYVTTLKGVMEKEDSTNFDFIVPKQLKEVYKKKDFGRYADKNGDIVTCFTSNNDITGGNSGSPIMNAKGELIGLAFDGNWEAMSGNIAFEPHLQKTINVDIRYVLFLIEKLGGAKNLIDELKIVTN